MSQGGEFDCKAARSQNVLDDLAVVGQFEGGSLEVGEQGLVLVVQQNILHSSRRVSETDGHRQRARPG